jgi:ankyrin repeat protein
MPGNAKEVSKAEEAIERADPLLLATALINGADPNSIVDETGVTLLHRACECNIPMMVTMLLEKGAKANVKDHFGKTPAFIAANDGHNGALIVLGKFGADFNVPDKVGVYPIHRSARNGHLSAISTLLTFKARVNVQTKDEGATPLHLCMPEGCLACAKMLIEHGASIDAQDHDGATPLIWAVQRGDIEIVKLLLEKGSAVNARDNMGRTPLIWAATKNDLSALIKLLIKHGADLSLKDETQNDALSRARLLGHKETEKTLLKSVPK